MISNRLLLTNCFEAEKALYEKNAKLSELYALCNLFDTDEVTLCNQEWFRQNHSNNKRDIVFSDFYKVEADNNTIILHSHHYGTVHIFRYDAEQSYRELNKKVKFKHIGGDEGHLSTVLNNTRITLEAFVFLAKCILEDVYPRTFEGLHIDVIDGSGTIYTNNKFGRTWNFWLDNVQPASQNRNLAKGTRQGLIYK